MSLQLGALRDALIEGGTTPELAGKAAEEVGGYETRLAALDTRLAVLTALVGVSITLSFVLIGGMLALWSRMGEVSGQLVQISTQLGRLVK